MNPVKSAWRKVPARVRAIFNTAIKICITVGAFYLLLTHEINVEGIGRIPISKAILDYIGTVNAASFFLWLAVAMSIKFVGVIASAWGWSLLLRGQRLEFPFWQQIMTAFLIGRFIGTFLPSTICLLYTSPSPRDS